MNKRNAKNAWSKTELELLTKLYGTPGMSIKAIVKSLTKAGFPRTLGAVSNRIYNMRLNGKKLIQNGGIKKKTGYTAKKGRMTSNVGKTTTAPIAISTGNVVIKHKMFTITATNDTFTITVNN